jgi:hypothetical protein
MYHLSDSVTRKLSFAIWVLSLSFFEQAVAMSMAGTIAETTCVREDSPTQASHAFIQVKRSAKDPKNAAPSEAALMSGRLDARGIGDTAPLDAFGYGQVKAKCCAGEMVKFIRRLIVEEHNLVVCSDGGLGGFAAWFDCEADKTNFAALEDAITDVNSKERIGDCPWIGDNANNCPTMMPPPTCKSFPDEPPLLPCKGCSIAGAVPFDFKSASLGQRNLAGLGPDTGAEILEYVGVGTFDSAPFNMIITALDATTYSVSDPATNGIGSTENAQANIGMMGSSKIEMKVELQRADGSPVKLPEFHLTFWDIDGNKVVTIKGFSDYVINEPTELKVTNEDLDAKVATFHNEIGGNSGGGAMNGNLFVLDDRARKAAVMMVFRETSEFQITFEKDSSSAGSSAIVFCGASSLQDQCDP